jgi:uncharacterized protein (TIGR03663 family)
MAERAVIRNQSNQREALPSPAATDWWNQPMLGPYTRWQCLATAVFLIAVVNRLLWLGERPFHHDESIHAFFSWKIVDEGISHYKYDPVYHGPVLYYASALVMWLFGDSDFTARLSAVLFGLGILAFAWPLRRWIGSTAAFAFLLLFTFSPALTYFTRFLRHDVYVGLGNIMAIYFAFRFGETRRDRYLYLSALGLAIAFCNKEDMYALIPVSLLSLVLMLVWEVLYAPQWRPQLAAAWAETKGLLVDKWVPIVGSAVLFLVVSLTFYTSFFTHPENWNPVTPALTYWWGQHQIKRIGGPWWYYFPQLVSYEFLIFFPALFLLLRPLATPRLNERASTKVFFYLTVATFAVFVGWCFYDWHQAGIVILVPLAFAGLTVMQRWLPSRFVRFMVIYTLGCVGFYSWAQEKVPWLLFPILMPMSVLAAVWYRDRIDEGMLRKPVAALATAGLSALTIWILIASNYLYGAPRPAEAPGPRTAELLAYVQSTYDIHMVMEKIEEVGRKLGTGTKTRLQVSGNATWPLSWYLRHYPVNWAADVRKVDTPVVIVDKEVQQNFDRALLDRYEKIPFAIRGWWEPDWSKMNTVTLARWLFTRQAWSPVGSSDAVMYVLKDLAPGAEIPVIAVNPPPAPRPYTMQPSLEKPAAVWGKKGSGTGEFNEPRGLAVDARGFVYVVDSKNHRIQKWAPEGQVLKTWGKEGQGPGEFKDPCGVAVGPDGSVYVADTWNHRIQKFTSEGKFLAEWVEQTSGFWGPRGIAVAPDGSAVFVTDTGNKRVVKFDPNGQQLLQWGKEGSRPGEFIEPVGLAFNQEGELYVADTGNRRVQVFRQDGTFVREHPVSGWEEFYTEPYIALLGEDLIATDSFNHRVARYNKVGALVYVWGKTGAGPGEFNRPIGVAVDADGAVYISDTMNHRIQKFVIGPAQ